jgi:excisionase family DNA binding protein
MKLYTVKEIAKLFGVKESSVRRWIHNGKLQATKLGNLRISEEELNKFVRPLDKNVGEK